MSSDNSIFVNQVEAAITEAQRALAAARQPTIERAMRVAMLARAIEAATRAVTVAWDDPRASQHKLIEFFGEHLASQLPATDLGWALTIWASDAQRRGLREIDEAAAAAERIVGNLAQVSQSPPPASWSPPEIRALRWEDLEERDRALLQEAAQAVRAWGGSGTRVFLHGSRARDAAGPGSDYDIFVVFPEDMPEWKGGQAMAALHTLEGTYRIETSRDWIYADQWENPNAGNAVLVGLVKRASIEIP